MADEAVGLVWTPSNRFVKKKCVCGRGGAVNQNFNVWTISELLRLSLKNYWETKAITIVIAYHNTHQHNQNHHLTISEIIKLLYCLYSKTLITFKNIVYKQNSQLCESVAWKYLSFLPFISRERSNSQIFQHYVILLIIIRISLSPSPSPSSSPSSSPPSSSSSALTSSSSLPLLSA